MATRKKKATKAKEGADASEQRRYEAPRVRPITPGCLGGEEPPTNSEMRWVAQNGYWWPVVVPAEIERRSATRVPHCHIEEGDDAVVVRVELPGSGKEDVAIEFVGDTFSVTAVSSLGCHFAGELDLPFACDFDEASATLTDGVLELQLPRRRSKVSVLEVN